MQAAAKCVFLVFIQGCAHSLAVDDCNFVNWRNSMRNVFRNFKSDMQGVTLIEYGLIAALIAVFLAAILGTVGTNLNSLFNTVSTSV